MRLAHRARIGAYEIVAAIGAGGMGEVYRAHDRRLGRDVALKILPAAFSSDPDRLQRFEQEARAAAAINHPNILALFDIGPYRTPPEIDGPQEVIPYVVAELLEGQTLDHRLSQGPLPVSKAAEYAFQMANGLAAAHDKGVIHRDLKPSNIFITLD